MTTALNFNPTEHNPEDIPSGDYELLPDDQYVAVIIESEIAEYSTGKGTGITLTWQILEGDYENRRVWQRITYAHDSKKAEAIGRNQLSNVCMAVGHTTELTDTVSLHDKPCVISVITEPAKGEYKAKNKIERCDPLSQGAGATPAPAASPAVPPAASSSPSSAPWKR